MIKVFFDGSCEPNPRGIVRYGAVIYKHDEIIKEIAVKANFKTEDNTNNVAEYCGLIASLKYLMSENLQQEEIYIFGDSKLVITQMSGTANINGGKYVQFADMAFMLLQNFSNTIFEWIPKERNTHADALSRQVR